MDKTLAGLLGAVSVLALPAHAATAPPSNFGAAMAATSYADLLKPIPNALALLKEQAETQSNQAEPAAEGQATVWEAQFWYHHHHHHHHWTRRRWHHHHHHHHHHNT